VGTYLGRYLQAVVVACTGNNVGPEGNGRTPIPHTEILIYRKVGLPDLHCFLEPAWPSLKLEQNFDILPTYLVSEQ